MKKYTHPLLSTCGCRGGFLRRGHSRRLFGGCENAAGGNSRLKSAVWSFWEACKAPCGVFGAFDDISATHQKKYCGGSKTEMRVFWIICRSLGKRCDLTAARAQNSIMERHTGGWAGRLGGWGGGLGCWSRGWDEASGMGGALG